MIYRVLNTKGCSGEDKDQPYLLYSGEDVNEAYRRLEDRVISIKKCGADPCKAEYILTEINK